MKSQTEFLYKEVFSKLNISKLPAFEDHIRKYFDLNSEILYAHAPFSRLFFTIKDAEILYDLVGMSEDDILHIIKRIPSVNPNWKVINTAQNIVFLAILKYYKSKGLKEKFNLTIMYFAAYHYAFLFNKYFKFGVKQETMEYTINRLSQKFLIKSTGSVFSALEVTVNTANTTYENLLLSNSDDDLIAYVVNMRTRLNSLLQNIAHEYYNDKHNYLNSESDNIEGKAVTPTDISSQIESIATKAIHITNSADVDYKAANYSAKLTNISPITVSQVVKEVNIHDLNTIKDLYRRILSVFFNAQHVEKEICSKLFLSMILDTYAKSFTKDESVLEIKRILDEILKKYSLKYNSTSREATKMEFRKAIFIYYSLTLQASSCSH